MFNFEQLEKRYRTDAAFNKVVNAHRQLIEQYGFLPDELRQAAFLAQYYYQINRVEEIIRSNEEWEQIAEARKLMQAAVLQVRDLFGPTEEKNKQGGAND
jgi:hypothetical protein